MQTRRVIAALAEVRAALASVEPARGAWVEVRGKIAAERERRERTTERWRIVTGIATAAAALLLTVSVTGQYGGIDALGPLAV
ncbi:MAG TPA: hypothetical protein VFM74_08590, partial [Candidatus Limnocylindria bacterium]|nr:hypothetical protein [Candidatus Limnocylindria bacterium]